MVYIIMIIIVNLKFNFSSILTFNCWPHPRPQSPVSTTSSSTGTPSTVTLTG